MAEQKPRYGHYDKDAGTPLFLRVANGKAGAREIAQGLARGTLDEKTKEQALAAIEDPPEIDVFREDLRELLKDLILGGVSHPVVQYLNAYMSSSLEMIEDEESYRTSGVLKQWLRVKPGEVPWIEAVVCYNLTIFIKAYGHEKIQQCPCCEDFFAQGKMKYKYCSEGCKKRHSPQ